MRSLFLALGLLGAGDFDVRFYGANADGTSDNRAAIQKAVDAAAAAGGGDVLIPGGEKPYAVYGPVDVRGNGVHVIGSGGASVSVGGNYGGPVFSVGMQANPGEFSGEYRPRCDGAYDGPAPAGNFPFDSRGKSCLAVTSHPLQYGLIGANGAPDYWETTDPLTVDVMVERRPGQTNRIVCGLADEWTRGAPWLLVFWESGFYVDIYDNDIVSHRIYMTCPTDPGVYRVSFQLDPASGRAAGWVDRKLVTTPLSRPWTPGKPLRRHDGFRPFMVGLAAPRVLLSSGYFTDETVYGLRVARTIVYEWTGTGQTLAARPGTPVNDGTQFTAKQQVGLAPSKLVGAIDFSGPVTGSPWIPCDTASGGTVLAWVPAARNYSTSDVSFSRLAIRGRIQQAVALAAHYDLRFDDVTATGMQGIGAYPFGPSYPIYLNGCKLQGGDAALVFWDHMGSVRDCEVTVCGVDGVRAFGGDLVFDRFFAWRASPYTETVMRFAGNEDGGNYTIRGLQVDNEEFVGPPSRAVIECVAGTYKAGRLAIDGADVARVDPPASFVRLGSHWGDAGKNERWSVSASGMEVYTGCDDPVSFYGIEKWFGDIDARSVNPRPGSDPSNRPAPDDNAKAVIVRYASDRPIK